MIILPSRNGMLLRNSNGIISSDCGGPVAFTCPCELLEGDNSDCFDTDCTPETYYVTWTGVQYCLTYVSGSTWSVTVGDIVVTLNLESASETASITVVDDGTTVFSGTFDGTSCIHRRTGTMENTVTPDTWGSVTYNTNCEQPAFSCSCTPVSGDNNGAFTTNETPGTYIAEWDEVAYCLEYDSENDVWTVTVGSLVITLDLFASSTTASLTVVDDGYTVYSGTYTGTSGVHRWSGTGLTNTVSGSDWGTAEYYTLCTQTKRPNCNTDCEMVTGTPCSCYGSGATPSLYYIRFDELTVCAEHDSGCIWIGTYGGLTFTLNLNGDTNTTTLIVTEGATTVFSGELEEGDCDNRLGGEIVNSLTNDWGDATFFPACSINDTCISGRLVRLEIIGLYGLRFGDREDFSPFRQIFFGQVDDNTTMFGFFAYLYNQCRLSAIRTNSAEFRHYDSSCNLIYTYYDTLMISAVLTGSTLSITVTHNTTGINLFVGGGSLPFSTMPYGDSRTYNNNSVQLYTTDAAVTCEPHDYSWSSGGSNLATLPISVKVTLY